MCTPSVNRPGCLPIDTSGACLSCRPTRTSPLGPCELWAIAAAMSGSIAGHDAQPGQEHPRDADHAVLALALFLVLARDHFVAPGHRLADVAEADLREFAQDLLDRLHVSLEPLVPGTDADPKVRGSGVCLWRRGPKL